MEMATANICVLIAKLWCYTLLLISFQLEESNAIINTDNSTAIAGVTQHQGVLVNKCCEKFEVNLDLICEQVNETEYFHPVFSNYKGENDVQVKYKFKIGLPNCGPMPIWRIYHYQESSDKLVLLDDGKLRHYTNTIGNQENSDELLLYGDNDKRERNVFFNDYAQDQYCIDKAMSAKDDRQQQNLIAYICLAKAEIAWTDANFLITKILYPIFQMISLIILLIIAIVYFILPTLRDLVGNTITTIAVCLIIAKAASLVRTFTEFTNHVSFIAAEIILHFSLLAIFFWLSSFGYYIWKMFRSRNVFLRVTDSRKYCYYSSFVWGSTFLLTATAVFAHYFLEVDSYKKQNIVAEQETMGWLGVSIFFAAITSTIVIDVFFYVTTLKLINRRNVYGRIQHKLKANFNMFTLMLVIISFGWILLCLSWLQYDGLLYLYLIYNVLEAPLLLYVCVIRQNHVRFLLKKSCCYNEPPSVNDWGDEMHYMNANNCS